MIEENYLYVDKTREIYNLFSDGKSISRLAPFPSGSRKTCWPDLPLMPLISMTGALRPWYLKTRD